MKNILKTLVTMSLVFGIFFGTIPDVKACGPFSVDPLFSFTKHGYYPLAEFVGDQPGIVPNTYGRISLFPFYRQLTETPLSKSESELVVRAIKKRIGIDELYQQGTAVNEDGNPVPDYIAEWLKARSKVFGSKTEIELSKSVPEGYGYYSNCLSDAFKTATNTLNSRIKTHGLGEFVLNWVTAQDAVFSNCGSDGKMPSAAPGGGPAWLQKDREYQIAAAYFYSAKLQEARVAFQNIAGDKDSPWKNTAKFVVARTLIRESGFIDTDEDKDGEKGRRKTEMLENAQTRLEEILSDSSMQTFHKSAARLIGVVKFRKNPPERQEELAAVLASRKPNPNIDNDLTDYIWLLDKPESKAYDVGYEIDSKEAKANGTEYFDYELKIRDLPKETRSTDLSDWLFTYQAVDGFDHAYNRWKETEKLHWFVSAFSKTTKDSPHLDELLAEATRINRSSPAFPTVRYHLIRLLLENGKRIEAKRFILDLFGTNFASYPISTQNRFLAQRMVVSENLDEFLEFAQRKAAIFSWSDDGNEAGDDLQKDSGIYQWKDRKMFDYDSVAYFNHKMPLETLAKAALSPKLPDHLKKFVITAAWTRAFLLKNNRIETELRPLMLKASPELRPLFSPFYRSRTQTEREANGLLFVLSYPVLQPYVPPATGRGDDKPKSIDSFRGNWWCTDSYNPFEGPGTQSLVPDFLNNVQKANAAREESELRVLGNSATSLTRRAIEFAKTHPRHRLTPQLLHKAVRSTRYGCGDKDTGALSKEAYGILHRRYPGSRWTKLTPYWFNGTGE